MLELELLSLVSGWGRGRMGIFQVIACGVTGAENKVWGGAGLSEVLKWDREDSWAWEGLGACRDDPVTCSWRVLCTHDSRFSEPAEAE